MMRAKRRFVFSTFLLGLGAAAPAGAGTDKLEWIAVDRTRSGLVLAESGRRFVPVGFNYDHDEQGRLLEDYWAREWTKVRQDFREMKALGANVVRVHLQLGRFLEAPGRPNQSQLRRLGRLLRLAERTGLRLDLTGLGCYHRAEAPPWYDALGEQARWAAQAEFWEAIARVCARSPAVFCYNLMNEPAVPGGPRPPGEWLGAPFAGKHFVQFITLDPAGRAPPEVAREWIRTLVRAIRRTDRRHLITVGLVDWSLDRPGLRSGFVPAAIAAELDFLSVHLYPKQGEVTAALETLRGFAVGRPLIIEETFPLFCPMADFEAFLRGSRELASGWIGFYWGRTPAELKRSGTPADGLTLAWLECFRRELVPLAGGRSTAP